VFIICFGFLLDRDQPATVSGQEQKPGSAAPVTTPTPDNGFGNVQVLKGVRDLLPTMHFIRASLGVRCDYCHITENGKYKLDDKPAKIRAREMIIMTRQINDTAFGGKQVITCNTCHRGSTKPVSVPPISTTFVNTTRREAFEPAPPAMPTVDEVLARYEASTHISTLGAAQLHLEVLRGKLINGGAPTARILPREDRSESDLLIDGDRGVTTTPLSNGQTSRVGSNGTRIWILGASGPQWISTGDLAQLRRKINPLIATQVRPSGHASMSVTGIEKINDVDTYVVSATEKDGSSETLWFSKQDGNLVRRTYYHSTLLGPEPEQYDLSNYKRFGSLLLPTVINTSYLDDQHLGVLKRLLEVKFDPKFTDSDFEPLTY
jgi:photosynthetic reaction center cytochrome c subunit